MLKDNILNINCVLILVLSLFACSPGTNEKNKSDKDQLTSSSTRQIQIKMMGQWFGQGDRERLIREFVKEYNFVHQDVKIILLFPEEVLGKERGNAVHQKWIEKELKAEQSEFDILMLNNQSGPIIADEPDWPQKYLVDFSEFKEFMDNTEPGIINDSLKNIWHGIIPGPLIEGYNYSLWCNNELAKKIGIKVKQFGMSFDDFIGYIKAVNEYNKSHGNDYIIPLFEAGNWKTLNNMFNQLFASYLNNKDLYKQDVLSERKLQAWYQTLKDFERLSDYEPFAPKWDTMIWDNNYHMMLEDKILFFSNGSWMYNFWQKIDNGRLKDIMPTEYPVAKPIDVYPGGYQIIWAVPKNAPHKEEAIKILLALNSSKVAEKWVRYTKCATGIKGKLATVAMGVDHFEDFTYQINKKYGMNKVSFSASQNYFNKEHRWKNNYAYDVLQKKISADSAYFKIRETFKKAKVKIEK